MQTNGNTDCHVILRGGKAPNYDAASVAAACKDLEAAELPPPLMVDCSHANSSKQHEKQLDVARDVAAQIAGGCRSVFGVMVESHLNAGAQKFTPGKDDPTPAGLRQEHHRRLPGLGRFAGGAGRAVAGGQATPRLSSGRCRSATPSAGVSRGGLVAVRSHEARSRRSRSPDPRMQLTRRVVVACAAIGRAACQRPAGTVLLRTHAVHVDGPQPHVRRGRAQRRVADPQRQRSAFQMHPHFVRQHPMPARMLMRLRA